MDHEPSINAELAKLNERFDRLENHIGIIIFLLESLVKKQNGDNEPTRNQIEQRRQKLWGKE